MDASQFSIYSLGNSIKEHIISGQTTLVEDLTTDASEISLENSVTFIDSGIVKINNEYIKYQFKDVNKLTQLERGYNNSTISLHAKDSIINGIFLGEPEECNMPDIKVKVTSATTGIFNIDFSSDQETWTPFSNTPYIIKPNKDYNLMYPKTNTYFRVKFQNTGTINNDYFSIDTYVGAFIINTKKIGDNLTNNKLSLISSCVSYHRQPDDTYLEKKEDGICFQTKSNLNSYQTFTTDWFPTSGWQSIELFIISDKPSQQNGVSIEFSSQINNTPNAGDIIKTYTYQPTKLFLIKLPVSLNGFRIKYQNGNQTQTKFQLVSILRIHKDSSGIMSDINDKLVPLSPLISKLDPLTNLDNINSKLDKLNTLDSLDSIETIVDTMDIITNSLNSSNTKLNPLSTINDKLDPLRSMDTKLTHLDKLKSINDRLINVDKLTVINNKLTPISSIDDKLDKLDTIDTKLSPVSSINDKLDKLDTIDTKLSPVSSIDDKLDKLNKLDTIDTKLSPVSSIDDKLDKLNIINDKLGDMEVVLNNLKTIGQNIENKLSDDASTYGVIQGRSDRIDNKGDDIWELGKLYSGHPNNFNPQKLNVVSSNSNDAKTKTGCQQIKITGLNSINSQNYTTELVDMNGTNIVKTKSNWWRIVNLEVTKTGSNLKNYGKITVSYNNVVFGIIDINQNQSSMCMTTIPKNKTIKIKAIHIEALRVKSIDQKSKKSKDKNYDPENYNSQVIDGYAHAQVAIMTKKHSSNFYTTLTEYDATTSQRIDDNLVDGYLLEEGTDIKVRVKKTNSNMIVNCKIEYLLTNL